MTTREEVQRELNDLKFKVNQKQNQLNDMKWRPKTNEKHYVKINEPCEFGIVFATQKRAEIAYAKYKRFHLLYKLAEELNESAKGHSFECWSIQYLGDSKKLVAVRFTEACGGLLPQVFFKTKDAAIQAINIIENGGLE